MKTGLYLKAVLFQNHHSFAPVPLMKKKSERMRFFSQNSSLTIALLITFVNNYKGYKKLKKTFCEFLS